MDKRKKILAAAGITSVVALGGGGLAYAGGAVGGEGSETAVTGAAADRAGKAAVDSVGGGTVVQVVEENEGDVAYEVEVKTANGSTTEVEITSDFQVAPPEKEAADEGPESGDEGPESGNEGRETADTAK